LINASISANRTTQRAKLHAAVTSSRNALKYLTKERSLSAWAGAQLTLSLSLLRLSEIAGDEAERSRLKDEALAPIQEVRLRLSPEAFQREINNIPPDLAALASSTHFE
jgi:hypothetical protein